MTTLDEDGSNDDRTQNDKWSYPAISIVTCVPSFHIC